MASSEMSDTMIQKYDEICSKKRRMLNLLDMRMTGALFFERCLLVGIVSIPEIM